MSDLRPVSVRNVTQLAKGVTVLVRDENGGMAQREIESIQSTIAGDIFWLKFEGHPLQPICRDTQVIVV